MVAALVGTTACFTDQTPPEGEPMHVMFTLPDAWADGTYRVRVEVNTEGDYNGTWNATTFPTPRRKSLAVTFEAPLGFRFSDSSQGVNAVLSSFAT